MKAWHILTAISAFGSLLLAILIALGGVFYQQGRTVERLENVGKKVVELQADVRDLMYNGKRFSTKDK